MLRRLLHFDWPLLVSVVLLYGVSLLALYSLSSGSVGLAGTVFMRQALYGAAGLVLFFFFFTTDYRHIARWSSAAYFVALVILAAVLVIGSTVRGTAGWLDFGWFQIQPVEMAKLVLIIFLASFLSRKKDSLGELNSLMVSLVLSGTMVFFVLRQPDLGSALVLIAIWAGMLFLGGLNLRHASILAVAGIGFVLVGWAFLQPYQRDRIATFFDPQSDPQGSGYNVLQALVAVGSGGVFGKGVGHGSQSQLNFLPERHTDFIFAVIGEELGFLGILFVLSMYALLFWRLFAIAMRAGDNFGYLFVGGVGIMLLVQVLVNVGMNMGLLPVTGIPLPLVSYGGSSLTTTLASLGMVFNIAVRGREETPFLAVRPHATP